MCLMYSSRCLVAHSSSNGNIIHSTITNNRIAMGEKKADIPMLGESEVMDGGSPEIELSEKTVKEEKEDEGHVSLIVGASKPRSFSHQLTFRNLGQKSPRSWNTADSGRSG